MLRVADRFPLYLVVWNWTGAWLTLLFDPASLVLMTLLKAVGMVLVLAALAFVLWMLLRLTRAALKLSTMQAVGLVLVQFLTVMVVGALLFPPPLPEQEMAPLMTPPVMSR